MQRQIRFKRLAIQWEHRRVPPIPSEKDQPAIGFIVLTYTLLLEDPFYPETVLSQRRITLNLSDMPEKTRDDFVENTRFIESVIKKSSAEKSLFVTSISYTPMGIDEELSGSFSIKSAVTQPQIKEVPIFNNSSVTKNEAKRIRAGLSKFDSFFYDYVLDKVRDENSRLGIKLEGL